jgi:hypothetical protein
LNSPSDGQTVPSPTLHNSTRFLDFTTLTATEFPAHASKPSYRPSTLRARDLLEHSAPTQHQRTHDDFCLQRVAFRKGW